MRFLISVSIPYLFLASAGYCAESLHEESADDENVCTLEECPKSGETPNDSISLWEGDESCQNNHGDYDDGQDDNPLLEIEDLKQCFFELRREVNALNKKIDETTSTLAFQEIDALNAQLSNGLSDSQGQQANELDCLSAKVDQLQEQVDSLSTQLQNSSGYECSHYRCPAKCHWETGVEWLWWTVQESELDYAIRGSPLTNDAFGAVGRLFSAEYNWKPGFRVFLDYTSDYDYWNVFAGYTFFFCNGKNSVTRPTNKNLNGTFHQVTDTLLKKATSHIDFHYNIFDLLLSRHFQLSPHILSRLQVGGIGAWIEQKWTVDYIPQPNANGFAGFSDRTNIDWKYHGGGIKAGAALDWYFARCWSLYTEANCAALIGWYRNRMLEKAHDSTGALIVTPFNSHNHQWRFAQTFQIKLGPSWSKCFKHFDLRIYALYEFNTWIGLQEVDRSFITGNVNDGKDSRHVEGFLGLQGLSCGIQAAF